jgi:hypothetical protein
MTGDRNNKNVDIRFSVDYDMFLDKLSSGTLKVVLQTIVGSGVEHHKPKPNLYVIY